MNDVLIFVQETHATSLLATLSSEDLSGELAVVRALVVILLHDEVLSESLLD